MLGGHSTLNTVLLGGGMSKYQIPPYYGHHSSVRFRRWRRVAVGGGGGGVGCGADCGAAWLRLPGVSGRPAIDATARSIGRWLAAGLAAGSECKDNASRGCST